MSSRGCFDPLRSFWVSPSGTWFTRGAKLFPRTIGDDQLRSAAGAGVGDGRADNFQARRQIIAGDGMSLNSVAGGFVSQIGIDGGIGVRLDFDFFIFRFDPAIPLRDPTYPSANRWTFSKMQLKNIVWNFGIGYPF